MLTSYLGIIISIHFKLQIGNFRVNQFLIMELVLAASTSLANSGNQTVIFKHARMQMSILALFLIYMSRNKFQDQGVFELPYLGYSRNSHPLNCQM